MMTGLENVLRSMFAAVEVSPEWFRIVIQFETLILTVESDSKSGFWLSFNVHLKIFGGFSVGGAGRLSNFFKGRTVHATNS